MTDTGFEVAQTIVEIPPTVETILKKICPNYVEQRETAIMFKITVTVNLETTKNNSQGTESFDQILFFRDGSVKFTNRALKKEG